MDLDRKGVLRVNASFANLALDKSQVDRPDVAPFDSVSSYLLVERTGCHRESDPRLRLLRDGEGGSCRPSSVVHAACAAG